MRTTRQLSVTLPNDMADRVKLSQSGNTVSASISMSQSLIKSKMKKGQ